MHRESPRNAPRVARTLACTAVAIPALLVAGCSSDSGGSEDASSAASPSSSQSPAPVKYKNLPNGCETLSKGTLKDLVPKKDRTKPIRSENANDNGGCVWSGLKKYDARILSVTMKRLDSDTTRGSGEKQATSEYQHQMDDTGDNKDNKKVKQTKLSGVGDQATTFDFEAKEAGETYHKDQSVVRDSNVVLTVTYQGAGLEGGKKPDSGELKSGAEKAAKELANSLKK